VRIRDLKPADAPRLLTFLQHEFPEEEAILGTRPEGFSKIVRRVFRWDARLIVGLLRRLGRPLFRFYVAEEDGRIVATTLLSFSKHAGYLSMVAVDPAYRRRGFARQLIETARRTTVARGKPYMALDVLSGNAPARALYESLGYQPLRSQSYFVHDHPSVLSSEDRAIRGVRPFHRSDARRLAEVARHGRPPAVEAVLPVTDREISGSTWVGRVLSSEVASWVMDDGSGPSAWILASVSPATEAAHVSAPIIGPSVSPEAAQRLVEVAVAWCAARKAPRLTTVVPAENTRGRVALDGAGFRDVIPLWTLYRSAA
jgi:ribosomal protein S18 acetylase RimI-like enzyme